MHLTNSGGIAVNASTDSKKVTPGFRSILVSEEAFDLLKKLQRQTYGHDNDPNGVRFDLKDVASAVVMEAMLIEELPGRSLTRAARAVFDSIYSSKEIPK